jgi:NAD(P)-dependent dehydrogenase (short-subunit alcohol dehydrogenase family)
MSFNPISLKNKKFLITGAASGLGKSISILLSQLGAELILVDINEDGLDDTIKSCETNSKKLILDLTNTENIRSKIEETVLEFGKIDGLVHSAGVSYLSPLKFIDKETTTNVFLLNTYAAIELSKIFTDRKISTKEGSIVFISSIYGCVGSVANVGYAMSKSALHGITKSLAIELASKKIRVNCVAPGFIETEMFKSVANNFGPDYYQNITNLHPLGLGKAEDIADIVAFLLSNMSRWITGSIINVDGGYTAQ